MKDSDEAIDIPFTFDLRSNSTLDDSGSDDPGEYLRIEADTSIYNLKMRSQVEDLSGLGDLPHPPYEMSSPLPEYVDVYFPKTNEWRRIGPLSRCKDTEDSE